MKSRADGIGWEDRVDGEIVTVMWEIVEAVRQQDLVWGKWHVPKSEKGIK